MVKQKSNRLEKWFIPSVVLSGIGLMVISLMNNPIGVFMNGIAAMIGINLPTISATLITYGVLNKVMLLLSARASREIVNAIEASAESNEKAIGANTKVLKRLEGEVGDVKKALKDLKDEVGGVKKALKDLKGEVGGVKEALKSTEGKADSKTDTAKQA